MLQKYFDGKSVLVTGAGRGIGKGVVQRLHTYGARVTAVARTQTHLDTLQAECPGVETICVDLEDWDATRTALKPLGPFHYLVNNAAILIPGGFMDVQPQDFDKMMNVNVRACINVAQIVAGKMMEAGIEGSILNMSSDCSSSPFPPSTVYCLSKAAIDMMTKIMAVELGPKKIRVNAINPAGVYTDMLHEFYEALAKAEGMSVEAYRSSLNARVPLGTYEMDMEAIVNSILFMLSPACPLIHGEMLFIDGGLRYT